MVAHRKLRVWVGLGVIGAGLFAACSDSVSTLTSDADSGTRPPDGGDFVPGDEDATTATDANVGKDSGTKPGTDASNDAFVQPDTRGSDAGPVAAGALVINEIDYDQVMTDSAEYIEIYNPSPTSTINMNNLALVFANGSGGTLGEYLRVPLSGNLDPLHYLVLAAPNVVVTNPVDAGLVTVRRFAAQSNNIQNGDPDGVAILDTSTNVVVDALSYGGALGTPLNFVEGTPATAKDSNDGGGALIREPNGTDTNNANADWKFTTTLTPGGPNILTP
jgi:hypothetical protein